MLIANTITHCFLKYYKEGVAITGRNRTGPQCSVGCQTVHAPGGQPAQPPASFPHVQRSAGPLAGSVTDDDRRRRQTTACKNNTGPLGEPVKSI